MKLSIIDYVDKLAEIFESNPHLSMISFTDHNKISIEVYLEFYSRDSNVKLIPGVEVDVKFSTNSSSKHLLVYFDDKHMSINEIAKKVNDILTENDVSSHNPIEFSTLIQQFIDKKLTFLLSPHAFKQGKRGINHEWIDEQSAQLSNKYANQFFCFWETSGYKEISKANIYMQDFLEGREQSIVSFSDSSSFDTIVNYLKKPPVFFNSLNSFRGIQLVGSDSRRITYSFEELTKIQRSKLIGQIVFNGDIIELSSRLNSIIGGRGSGKSILIDKIASKTKSRELLDNSNRNNFLQKYSCELYDMNGNCISDDFEVDYFNQSYVSKIFDGKNTNEEIKKYFTKEFDSIESINIDNALHSIKSSYTEKLNSQVTDKISGNIGDLVSTFVTIEETDLSMVLFKKNIVNVHFIDKFDLDKQKKEINKQNIVPKEIIKNDRVKKAIHAFQGEIVESINEYNAKLLNDMHLTNQLLINFFKYKDGRTEEAKMKSTTEQLLTSKINLEFSRFIERVKIVNALLETSNSEQFVYKNFSNHSGHDLESNYEFTKEFIIETPIAFFLRTISNYVGKNKYDKELTFDNFMHIAKDYCFSLEKFLNPSKSMNELDDELREFKIKSESFNRIYYNGKLIDNESPGTKTNILMEYIVNSRNEIPLLIDQPEDNIDNHTIYNKLTDWFSKLKKIRQIIVVSHDANIVINSDSENMISAKQEYDGVFRYKYGALEYEDNLEAAAMILDGGVKAVKRRLNKYGEE